MHAAGSEKRAVILAPMLHSSEAQCLDDDWTGLRDRTERRKRQTRLNVRAHRKRKAVEARQKEQDNTSKTRDPWGPLSLRSDSGPGLKILQWAPPVISKSSSTKTEKLSRSTDASPIEEEGIQTCSTNEIVTRPQMRRESRPLQVTRSKLPKHTPLHLQNPATWFPLYRDHLIPLVYYNVLRATITNINILSLDCLLQNSCSPHHLATPLFPSPSQIPHTLLPTATQISTPHEPWIDIFPSGTMRDNAIKYRDTYSQHELCIDLVGCHEGDVCHDQPGFIVWSDPWHPDGWEVTEKFVKKWGFLLEGCEDVMRATNRWRALRDEEPLVWEVG